MPVQPPPLKILSISDFEVQELTRMVTDRELKGIDLILSCGDMAPEYLSFLRDRLDAPLFYVKGNHDIRYTSANPMGCENIHGKIVTHNGLNILGLEGSMWYNGGVNQYTETMMRRQIFRLWFSLWRKKIHLVITHAPPRHIHDGEDLCHRGFESFGRLIRKYQPRYFIHGHVHAEFQRHQDRETRVGDTRVLNTCGYTSLEIQP